MASHTQIEVDGVTVLQLAGDLTRDALNRIETPFLAAATAHPRAVVDISQVEMLNSSGICMLLRAAGTARKAGGAIFVAGARGMVLDVLRHCRLETVLKMTPVLNDAVKLARAHP
ncbi:MAG TPA: STAS domain-containing protein [Tepidisphaeraceae bacterium]|jgi:anti-anti-sigma factor|nr:STAS domain-containing protein [Tepidisphaeraceae bacterium]